MNSFELWLVQQLNGWVGQSPAAFTQALTLTDRLPWMIATLFFAAFWFVGEPGAVAIQEGGITRIQSRRRLVLIWCGMVIALAIAYALQTLIVRQPPMLQQVLLAPIQYDVLQNLQASAALRHSFPAAQAVVFFSVVVGAFSFNRYLGWGLLLVYLYFCALYIGLGLVWPTDIIAGAALGTLVTITLIYTDTLWRKPLTSLALAFERYPRLLYPLAFLILFDLSHKLVFASGMLSRMFGNGIS